eukprot:TRINITY_DN1709_c0_g2_i2.p1 TRINITY_DN1709_c0_g2~~TRINITY_DN1709_c0_g2_i2.p1  ORF type:complete len:234 (+),score=50.22 TRINITY_DN1709_c0_g2_i2:103-804(+)
MAFAKTRNCARHIFFAAFALVLPDLVNGREAAVVATGNPYQVGDGGTAAERSATCETRSAQDDVSTCSCPVQGLALPTELALTGLRVQTDDAFLRLESRRVAGREIELYHFKQPQRLSSLELSFKILPLRRIDFADVEVIEVAPKDSLDSWFPGYAWSVIVCTRCNGLHLGWKFTPTSTQGEAFFGLIVDTVEGDEEVRLKSLQHLGVLAGLRVVGQPLAALGLAAVGLRSSS